MEKRERNTHTYKHGSQTKRNKKNWQAAAYKQTQSHRNLTSEWKNSRTTVSPSSNSATTWNRKTGTTPTTTTSSGNLQRHNCPCTRAADVHQSKQIRSQDHSISPRMRRSVMLFVFFFFVFATSFLFLVALGSVTLLPVERVCCSARRSSYKLTRDAEER
jgi:hypothetical protein